MSRSPFFRLNLLLEIPRPSPAAVPRDGDAEDANGAHSHDGEQDVVLLPMNKDPSKDTGASTIRLPCYFVGGFGRRIDSEFFHERQLLELEDNSVPICSYSPGT